MERLDSDLLFYDVVCYAFRRKRLRAFLAFMALAKNEAYWNTVRTSKETQTTVIDVFLRDSLASISDAIRLLPLWINAENQIDEPALPQRDGEDRTKPSIRIFQEP
jgi:hypothetical protein